MTRRSLLRSGGAMVVASGLAYHEALRSDPHAADDSALVQAMVDAGDTSLPARRYVLDRPITVHGPRRIAIAAGAEFHYVGPSGGGVFRVTGDDVTIAATGDGAIVSSPRPRLDLWAIEATVPHRLKVMGIAARECGHVHVGTGGRGYGDIVATGPDAHIASGIVIHGGGARYAAPVAAGNGACWIEYALDWRVEDATYEHVSHGVEWWGGNAAFDADGRPGAERKCRNFHIRDVTVRDATLGGIWGAMGRDGLIEGCTVERCGDVGLDAEGCANVRFVGCTARDSHNGALATFFASEDVVFEDCTATSSRAGWPLFRSYNASLNPAAGGMVTLRNCRFACSDLTGPSTLDTRSGPLFLLSVERCTLRNVRIDTCFNNMHVAHITGNTLAFPFAMPDVPAIRVGSSRHVGNAVGGAIVENNVIAFAAIAQAGIVAIEEDYNGTAETVIRGNTVSGPARRGIVVRNGSGNAGIRPLFTVERNAIAGAAVAGAIERADGSAPPRLVWNANRHGAASLPAPRLALPPVG